MKKECYFCGTEVECRDLVLLNMLERMECETCGVYDTEYATRACYLEKKPSVLTKEDKDKLLKYLKAELPPGETVPWLDGKTIYKLTGK